MQFTMLYKLFPRIVIFSLALSSTAVHAEKGQYGHTTFPNSGASEAQVFFMEGLLLLHSFEFEDARKSFQKAREIDKDFAMAYWGEALTHYRVLWNEIELEESRAVLLALGATAQERAGKAAQE